MTTTQRLDEKCGHGLVAWKVDGYHYHERTDQRIAVDGTKEPSRGLMVDACDSPPGVTVLRERKAR
jgi:hypothetical protein